MNNAEEIKALTGKESSAISNQEMAYISARQYIVSAQQQVYRAVNASMVTAYWNIGKLIYEISGENERAAYGRQLLQYLSEKLSAEFGKGFEESNLRNMRRFYLAFPIQDALRPELSWTHYRLIMKIPDENIRMFYVDETANLWPIIRHLRSSRTGHPLPLRYPDLLCLPSMHRIRRFTMRQQSLLRRCGALLSPELAANIRKSLKPRSWNIFKVIKGIVSE